MKNIKKIQKNHDLYKILINGKECERLLSILYTRISSVYPRLNNLKIFTEIIDTIIINYQKSKNIQFIINDCMSKLN